MWIADANLQEGGKEGKEGRRSEYVCEYVAILIGVPIFLGFRVPGVQAPDRRL